MNLPLRLQKFYLGFYGRPADVGGYAYWLEQSNGAYFNQDSRMAAAFGSVDQAEFRALYGQSPYLPDFISRVYLNLFGRVAEPAGIAAYQALYDEYTAQGISGDEARAILIARIIDGASGSDKVAIDNKVAIAVSFTDELKLRVASISDAIDLARVQAYFAGAGTDAWRLNAQNGLSAFVKDIGANDSVANYMDVLVTNATGVTPMPTATARLSYSKAYLLESDDNLGQIGGSVQVVLTGGSFAKNVGDSLGTVTGTPAGLTAKLVKTSENTALLEFTGRATSHAFANSTSSIKVTFTDADLAGGLKASTVEGASKPNLGIGFIDAAVTVSNGLVTASGSIANSLTINLSTDKLLIGGASGRPIQGTLTEATGADLTGTAAPAGATETDQAVSFVGDDQANVYRASYAGDSIRGGEGNDSLTAGAGQDVFIFEADADTHGVDTITGFSLSGVDILDFSLFLAVPGTANVAAQTANSEQLEWANGDILVYQGASVLEASDVADLFDATGSDTTTPFSYAVSDGKVVLITSGASGDARIWFIEKSSNATETFNSARNVIVEGEIQLVGILKGVSNLSLLGFEAGHFEPPGG